MNNMLLKLYVKFQDLVEYALLVSLIALGSIVAVGKVTTAISTVFTNISTSIT